MAFKVTEAWISANQNIVAVKTTKGGWLYFVNTGSLHSRGVRLRNDPVVASEISSMNLEMVEAKS